LNGKMIPHVVSRIEADQVFGHRRWLNLKEPPDILSRKLFCRLLVHCQRGRYVEQGHFLDAAGMVQTKTMGDSATAIVTGYQKALVSELPHDFNLVKSHGTKGIVAVVLAVSRLA